MTDDDSARLVSMMHDRLQAEAKKPIRLIETHISRVLLADKHAWKFKKPVALGFLDFSTLASRRRACIDELILNRRLAPALYEAVVPVYGPSDNPRFGPDQQALATPGQVAPPVAPARRIADAVALEPIDYALRMKRFDDGALFSERLAAGRLGGGEIDRFARRLAAFHASVPACKSDPSNREQQDGWGSAASILATVMRTLDGLATQLAQATEAQRVRLKRVRGWIEKEGNRLTEQFEARKAEGWVRECHGDLHLANVVVLDDDITGFDCIEFDPALRWIDVQNDVAFLIMDLAAHGRADLGWRFLDRWLTETGDYGGVSVLRFYLVYRALVRALVSAIRAGQAASASGPDFLGLADRLADASQGRLMITCGLSGSGKSHVAQQLLEAAGALRIRSDVERKRMAGMQALQRSSPDEVGGTIYGADSTRRTYAKLAELAGIALAAGWPVIVDATFLRRSDRQVFRALAARHGTPFTILHCHAPIELLRERIVARAARGDDASEAGLQVLEHQLTEHDRLDADELGVTLHVDTSVPVDAMDCVRRWHRHAGIGAASGDSPPR